MDAALRRFVRNSEIYRGPHRPPPADLAPARQSRLESGIEAFINVATGFGVSWAVWVWVVPVIWYDLDPGDPAQAVLLTTVFTVTSLLRSYAWRRFFANNIHKRIHTWLS
jgi:hypothetical protein